MAGAHGPVEVRQFVEADRPAILALAPQLAVGVASWRPVEGVAAATVSWVEDAMAGADRDDRAVLVASSRDAVVGFLGVGERTHFSGQREAYVGELVVDPDRRREGIARLLLDHARGWAAARDLQRLSLDTGCANEAALAFYRALGFDREQVMLSVAVEPGP